VHATTSQQRGAHLRCSGRVAGLDLPRGKVIDLDAIREAGLPGLDLGVPVLDTPCSHNTSCILSLQPVEANRSFPYASPTLREEQINKARIMSCLETAQSEGSGCTIRQGALDVAVGETQGDGAVAVRLLQRAVPKAYSAAATDAVRLLLA